MNIDEQGLAELRLKIKKTSNEIKELRVIKQKLYCNLAGNQSKETFAIESLKTEEDRLLDKLNFLEELEMKAIVTNKQKGINISSKVTLELNGEVEVFKIVSLSFNHENEISVNSELGKILLGKEVGYEGTYTAALEVITVKVLNIK